MKNLKKVLCLALAFAMVLGLVVVGSAAQDVTTLTDWDEVTDKNSATLLNAFEIMQGDERGFRPDDTLTRAEAAKMISVALWGGSDDVALYAAGNIGNYKDVVTGSWYMGYVNFMNVKQIMVGDENGNFNPGKTVTGYELLKMCLVALGYNPETEMLTGAGWDIRTMAIATKASVEPKLTAGTTVSNWNAPLTRMNAATIIANMVWRPVVNYSLVQAGGTSTSSQLQENGKSFGEVILKMKPQYGQLIANEGGSILTISAQTKIDTTDRKYKNENALVDFTVYDQDTGLKVANPTAAAATAIELNSTVEQLGSKVVAYYKTDKNDNPTEFVYAAVVDAETVTPKFDLVKNDGTFTNVDESTKGAADLASVFVNGNGTNAVKDMDAVFGTWSTVTKSFSVDSATTYKCLDTDGSGYIDTIVVTTFNTTPLTIADVGEDEKDGTIYMTAGKWDAAKYTKKTLKDTLKASVCDFEAEKGDKVVYVDVTNSFGETLKHGYVLETVAGKIGATTTNKLGQTVLVVDGENYIISSVGGDTTKAVAKAEGTLYLWNDGTVHSFALEAAAAVGKPVGTALITDSGYSNIDATDIGDTSSATYRVAATLPDGTSNVYEVAAVYKNGTTTTTDKCTAAELRALFLKGSSQNGAMANVRNDKDCQNWVEASLVEYSLTDEGKIVLFYNAANRAGDSIKAATEVKTGVAKVEAANITTSNVDLYFNANSVTYIQTAENDIVKGTTEKWTAVKGTGFDSYKVAANKAVAIQVGPNGLVKDDNLHIAYAVIKLNDTEGVTTTANLYVITGEVFNLGKNSNNDDTFKTTMYNSNTGKVETVEYAVHGGVTGGMYTTFSTAAGFSGAITATQANSGAISNIGDGILRVANPLSATVWTITEKTNYFSVDGENTAEVKVADVATQEAVVLNQYQAIVIAESGNSNNAATVLVFPTVQGIPTTDTANYYVTGAAALDSTDKSAVSGASYSNVDYATYDADTKTFTTTQKFSAITAISATDTNWGTAEHGKVQVAIKLTAATMSDLTNYAPTLTYKDGTSKVGQNKLTNDGILVLAIDKNNPIVNVSIPELGISVKIAEHE